jgi:hypothetical protein
MRSNLDRGRLRFWYRWRALYVLRLTWRRIRFGPR